MIGRSELYFMLPFKEKEMYIGFHVKARGESHREGNIPCQDAASHSLSKNKNLGVAVVADGHGGEKYFRSDKGAKLAARISSKAILSFTEERAYKKEVIRSNKISDLLRQIESNIIYQWRKEVLEDIQNNPFNENELSFCNGKNIDIK